MTQALVAELRDALEITILDQPFLDGVPILLDEVDRLRATNAKLLAALEGMIASSDAIAHAAPTALDGLSNARELHLGDVVSRDKARAAIEEARK